MCKYKFIFDKKVFCKNRRCICVSYLPSKLLLLLPTLLQVIFDQAKRLVVIVNIMHSLHLRNKLCLIIKICIFKNHFLVKNMLQTPQLSPYLLVFPPPSSAIVCLFACLFVSKEAFVVSVLPQPLHLVLLRLLPFL